MTEPPRHFQHYEVLRRADGSPWELGRGAMGVTYKAYDTNLCCEVALKVVNSALLDHPDARERFVREARAAAALRHRHVASVYHLGNDGQHFFYAMEFIDGETLDALVKRRGPLPVGVVLKMILQVTKALVAADRQHLIHRDLKPTNLMIVHEDADEETTVKVIDFGLARQAAGTDGAAQLTIGGFVGTPQYASPEQLEEQPLDARTDIYSLGVTAWFLLIGRPPFFGSLASVCQQQVSQPPPWEQLPAGLDEGVRRLLGQMLEKDPAKRPQSARELRTEIEKCLDALPPAMRPDPRLASFGQPDSSSALGPEVPPTTFCNGRYTVLGLLDEEPGVKIYRARDEDRARRPVTLRTLPGELVGDAGSTDKLIQEVRLIQAAAHPNLVEIFALEIPPGPVPAFLVEEPLASFSLHELLTMRQTHLSAPDALRLLEPAAAAADHADGRRLEHLDFTLRHLRIHFPAAGSGDGEREWRGMLSLRLAEWPEWNLKIHPFATDRPALESGTWTGDITLAHAVNLRSPAAKAVAGKTNSYLPALAGLTYELLGGTLPAGAANGSLPATYASLPSLDEAGNTVLRRALSSPDEFATCRDFCTALAKVAEGRREFAGRVPSVDASTRDGTAPPATSPLLRPARSTALPPPLPPRAMPSADENPADAHSKRRSGGSSTCQLPVESIATLIADHKLAPAPSRAIHGKGSAWERLSLSEPKPPRPGRWLLALTAVILVFGAAFAGVFFFLLRGSHPSRTATTGPSTAVHPTPPRAVVQPPSTPVPPAGLADPPRVIAAGSPARTTGRTAPPVTVEDVEPESTPVAARSTFPGSTPATTVPSPGPEAAEVSVHLESEPAGAMVWRNEQRLGATPTEAKLPPGDYDLIYRKPGWQATHQYLHVDASSGQAPETIHLVPANYDPLLLPPPIRRTGTGSSVVGPPVRRPGLRGNAAPVRSAVPVDPAGSADQAPVLHAVPIQPFRHPAADVRRGNEARSIPPRRAGDED